MHGTGTQAGDASGMESVLMRFAEPGSTRPDPLFLVSAKSNVGYGESVSGAIAMVKVLMMLEKNLIPPHCGIKNKVNYHVPHGDDFTSDCSRLTRNFLQT